MQYFLVLLVALTFSFSEAKTAVGSAFPEQKLEPLKSGAAWSISKSKGKVVLVDVWASFCEPCKIAMPALDRIYKKYKANGLEIIGVNVDEDKKDGLAFVAAHPVSFPLYADHKQTLVNQLGVQVMPTSYLVDKTGKIHSIHAEYRTGDDKKLEELIKGLLK